MSSVSLQMDRFFLFRLPSVAISEVMKKFHLFDLTILSMCSKKTRRWIKTFHPYRDDVKIEVRLFKNCFQVLIIEPGRERLYYEITSNPMDTHHFAKFDDSVVPMSIEMKEIGNQMNVYFENGFDGLKIVTEYFCSFFEKDIHGINVFSYSDPDEPEIVMEWILERQKTIHDFTASCKDPCNTVAKYLFGKVNNAKKVIINMKIYQGFKFDFKFEGEYIGMHRCDWLRLDNLLNINCSELYVSESRITNEEMNTFLKHWMTNDLKFKEIYVDMFRLQSDVLFSGIPFTRRGNDVERSYRNYENELITMRGGFDIQRHDGKTATIAYNGETRDVEFWMIVWDNQDQ